MYYVPKMTVSRTNWHPILS